MERWIDLDLLQARSVLPILLQDRTTNQNIIWATDTYGAYGERYNAKESITAALVTGENSGIIQPRIAKAVSEQAERTRKRAEVATPAWVCNMMVNHCDEVWFGRKDVFNTSHEKTWIPTEAPIAFPKKKRWQRYVDSRWLEITCGEAPYLVSRYDASSGERIPFPHRIGILDRKLRVVNENAADEAEWLKFAFRALESVYGYEYQGDNLLIARVNVLMTFMDAVQERWQREATDLELRKAAEIISWNIWQMDGLKGTVPTDSLYARQYRFDMFSMLGLLPTVNEAKRIQCKIKNWRDGHRLVYLDRKRKKGREAAEMKFDFVIGNPPYQETQEATSDKPVYNYFMDASYKVADRVELITPARFLFNAGKTPKAWNEKMLNDPHFKVLKYEQDSSRIFANTDIKGGVVISYRDATQDYGAIGVFSHHQELLTIRRKVVAAGITPISNFVFSPESYKFTKTMHDENPSAKDKLSKGHDFDLTTNILDKLEGLIFFSEKPKDGREYAQIYGRKGNVRSYYWICKDYLQPHDNLQKWKVILPKSNGSGTLGEPLSTPVIGQPMIGHTQSFISIGALDTEYEALSLLKYIKTKFVRTMLGILKITQDNKKAVWRFVPLQDFTSASDIDWSVSIAEIDRQLYKKYNLSKEEIAFIETHVKEMA